MLNNTFSFILSQFIAMPSRDLERQPLNENNQEHFKKRAIHTFINVFRKPIMRNDNSYTFINPKLKANTYDLGDAYDHAKLNDSRKEWCTQVPEPYLRDVKELSGKWPHLRLLSDFMEVGTSPLRWNQDTSNEEPRSIEGVKQSERQEKINVRLLEYTTTDVPTSSDPIDSKDRLLEILGQLSPDKSTKLRLFVVEDLSRDVIEHLGRHFRVEPDFWRAHILDHAWYNVKDFWRNPPNLNVLTKHQRWFQLRFVRARYFGSADEFKEGFEEAQKFNVARRPDDDQNNTSLWDNHDAKVGLTRSRVSLWMRPVNGDEPTVGILLLDPTNITGYPLWGGHRNWAEPPEVPREGDSEDSFSQNPIISDSESPLQSTLFNDFLYWARRPETFLNQADNGDSSHFKLPVRVLLHLVCAEWLTISDYVKTRLNQIDWEIAHPSDFLRRPVNRSESKVRAPIDQTLSKLHVWRRFVPLYREMLSETLVHIFQARPSTSITSVNSNTGPPPSKPRASSYITMLNGDPEINAYKTDFEFVLSYMEEYQQRIDRLTQVATAAISIEDSRRGISDNNNIQRLTYLATFFIPMSFVAALLSMQPDVTQLRDTLAIWAEAALPAGFLIMLLIDLTSSPSIIRRFPWFGQWRPFKQK
ncbi:hypothetical protein F5X99DRAFT_399979 [Biscogniauxia marginata]|nr:hypothetical protein F5X99DRAFT_399979 [Biscogniauxia marginata]